MSKPCHTQFKVGGLYLYDLPHISGRHSKCIVEIIKRFNNYAKVKILKVIEDNTGNKFYTYLCGTNNKYLYSASYKYLKEIDLEMNEEVVNLGKSCNDIPKKCDTTGNLECKKCPFKGFDNLCEVAKERKDLSLLEILISEVNLYLGNRKFESRYSE